jgi:histidinol-phosphate/aromatic aminotransferase/cobyric acid decarboxylase-like protein
VRSKRSAPSSASDADRLKLYPDPTGSQLKAAVARHFGIAPEWVFVGNSSDEVLAHTFQALLKHERAPALPGHHLQLLPGVLRPVRHRLRGRAARRRLHDPR